MAGNPARSAPMRTGRFRADRALYGDLVRVPFKSGGRSVEDGLDCLGVAYVLLTRLRGAVPLEAFPVPAGYAESAQAASRMLSAGAAARWWRRVADRPHHAREPGDVILTLHGRDYEPHVSTLACALPPRVVLSARSKRGVYVLRMDQMVEWGECVGVYRLRETDR